MKKVFSFVLLVLAVGMFVACEKKDSKEPDKSGTTAGFDVADAVGRWFLAAFESTIDDEVVYATHDTLPEEDKIFVEFLANGTFHYIETGVDSIVPLGTWLIENDSIKMLHYDDEGDFIEGWKLLELNKTKMTWQMEFTELEPDSTITYGKYVYFWTRMDV